jgi:MoaA/NifB/PqqE/SkfB family radical SAM enzyme
MTTPFTDRNIGWPEVIVLPVTYFCNANCDMCALGELNQRDHLPDDELVALFADPSISGTLRAINFTGGEPTTRRDLPGLIARLIDVCPQIESFSLNSNGMLPTSADTISKVIEVGRSRGKKVYIFISLDGIGDLHDDIRGVPGAFEKTVETIETIRALNIPGSEMKLGVSATATRKNVDRLSEVLDFAVARDILVSFTFPLLTDIYMSNSDRTGLWREDDLATRFADFIDRLTPHAAHVSPPLSFYADLQTTLRGGRRTAACIFRRGGFFLEPTGQVRPCWRSSELLFGSIHDTPFEEIWNGKARARVTSGSSRNCSRRSQEELRDLGRHNLSRRGDVH